MALVFHPHTYDQHAYNIYLIEEHFEAGPHTLPPTPTLWIERPKYRVFLLSYDANAVTYVNHILDTYAADHQAVLHHLRKLAEAGIANLVIQYAEPRSRRGHVTLDELGYTVPDNSKCTPVDHVKWHRSWGPAFAILKKNKEKQEKSFGWHSTELEKFMLVKLEDGPEVLEKFKEAGFIKDYTVFNIDLPPFENYVLPEDQIPEDIGHI